MSKIKDYINSDVGKAITTGASTLGSSLLSNGMSTAVGSGLQTIGAAVGQFNPLIGAGLQAVGGLTNAAFGLSRNDANISKIDSQTKEIANTQVDSSNTQSIINQQGNQDWGANFSKSDMFNKIGWFKHGQANREYNDKVAERQNAIGRANSAYTQAIDTYKSNTGNKLAANSMAFGGPLFGINGPMDYELANKQLANEELNALSKDKITSLPNSFMNINNTFAQGGGIHIEKNKKGTFTAAATRHGKSVQEFASQVLANKDNYSPLMVKKANFARNAANWHSFGGELNTNGANFTNGLIQVNAGGTHESNPFQGVPVSLDQEGNPNLVEEGEVIFNDYVFSNRLKLPKKVAKQFKLGGSMSFADAAKKLSKESEERPNDPISLNGLEDNMMKLMNIQEFIKAKKNKNNNQDTDNTQDNNQFAGGGSIFSEDSLKEDALRFHNYIFGRKGDKEFTMDPPLFRYGDVRANTVDDIYRELWAHEFPSGTDYINRIGMPIIDTGIDTSYTDRIITPTSAIDYINKNKSLDPIAINNNIKRKSIDLNLNTDSDIYPTYDNWMRYLGPLGSLVGLGLSLPAADTSYADSLVSETNKLNAYSPITYNPIGNYLRLDPIDQDRYLNTANAQAAATRRSVINTSGQNRATAMAGLLAADKNALTTTGDMLIKAKEYNDKQAQTMAEFNRQTNMTNADNQLKADMANLQAATTASNTSLTALTKAAELRQLANQTRDASISGNISNLFKSLANIGEEQVNRMDRYTLAKTTGAPYTEVEDKKKAYGGALKRKKRKGFTY
jgi:hypothetical protein